MTLTVSWDPTADNECDPQIWGPGAVKPETAKLIGDFLTYIDLGLPDETPASIGHGRVKFAGKGTKQSGAMVDIFEYKDHLIWFIFAVDWPLSEARILILCDIPRTQFAGNPLDRLQQW